VRLDTLRLPLTGHPTAQACHGGFEQSYNAQAAVDTNTMLAVAAHVSQAPNDKREVSPILDKVEALPDSLGQVSSLLADSGYFSAANVNVCASRFIEPMLSIKREAHHIPVLERFCADAPEPETDDPVAKMVHRLGTEKVAYCMDCASRRWSRCSGSSSA